MENMLDKLRSMTGRIPSYNPWYFDEKREIHLSCPVGDATSIGVYKDSNISIGKTTFSPGTALSKHCHQEREIIMVLVGEITVVLIEGRKHRTVRVKQHEMLEVPPMVRHYSYCDVGTVIIFTLLPGNSNYPPDL